MNIRDSVINIDVVVDNNEVVKTSVTSNTTDVNATVIIGPQGPQGYQGYQGYQGSQGSQGAQGPVNTFSVAKTGDTMTGSLTINHNDGLTIPDPSGSYNQLTWDRTPSIGGEQMLVRGSSTQTGGVYSIFKARDRLGQDIAWLVNAGGLKITDAISMLDGTTSKPQLRLDYLHAGSPKRGVEALIFGQVGNGGYSVTHTDASNVTGTYTVDSFNNAYIRLQDNGSLRIAPNIVIGSENTSLNRSDITVGYGVGTSSTSGIKIGNSSIYVGGDGLWYSDNWGSFTASSVLAFTTLSTWDGNISSGGTGSIISANSITASTGLTVTTGGASITGDTTVSSGKVYVPTTSSGVSSITSSGLSTAGLRWDETLGIVFITGNTDRWRIGTSGNLVPATSGNRDVGATTAQVQNIYLNGSLGFNAGSVTISYGTTGPNSVVTASPGSLYMKSDGTAWVKSSGTSNTGWKQITAV